jgi:hypothetical protein
MVLPIAMLSGHEFTHDRRVAAKSVLIDQQHEY